MLLYYRNAPPPHIPRGQRGASGVSSECLSVCLSVFLSVCLSVPVPAAERVGNFVSPLFNANDLNNTISFITNNLESRTYTSPTEEPTQLKKTGIDFETLSNRPNLHRNG